MAVAPASRYVAARPSWARRRKSTTSSRHIAPSAAPAWRSANSTPYWSIRTNMISFTINGLKVQVEKGTTVLEAARWVGFPIPTLCAEDGLRPYGACRMCMVEIGEAPRTKLVAACTYAAEEGLKVRTNSEKVQQSRKLLLELYVSVCPQSKRIQDLASEYGVRQCRYDDLKHEHCIQCGLCVRMCEQQMMAGAIGFSGRGV